MTGDSEAARKLIDEALVAADETGELFWTAELHRLRGAATDNTDEAAAAFEQAAEIARRQGAVRLERRIADARA